MENISEKDRASFEANLRVAERSDAPSVTAMKVVNLLYALETKGLPKVAISGDEVRNLLDLLERGGINIPVTPWKKISDTEKRSIRAKLDTAISEYSINKLPLDKKPETRVVKDYSAIIERQKKILAQAIEETRPDPLLAIAMKRNVTQQLPTKRAHKKR